MLAFDDRPKDWSDLDRMRLHNGFIHTYWSNEILDVGAVLAFPDYYGKNLNALNDCLGDVARYAYGADSEATGTVLVVGRYDSFVVLDKPFAKTPLDMWLLGVDTPRFRLYYPKGTPR